MSEGVENESQERPVLIGGRYEILHPAGEGAVFRVYKARDTRTTTTVALKELKEPLSADAAVMDRLEQGARALTEISHPRVVRVLDVVREAEAVYIVTEWVSGIPLTERIARSAPMSPEAAVDLSADVARALSAVHALGLIHGDVRPASVLVGGDGRARLDDLAASRALAGESGVDRRNVLRWAQCSPPEVLNGAAPTPTADTYGLGCLLFWMLTGQPPFPGDNALVVALRVEKDAPRPPSSLNASVPPALDAIVAKALDKDPARRYPEAGAMLSDLTRAQEALRNDKPLDWTPTQNAAPKPVVSRPAQAGKQTTGDDVPPSLTIVRNLLLMLIGVGMVVSIYFLYGLFQPVEDVVVPDVVGKDQEAALQILGARHLVGAPRDRESERPKGEVINQEPRSGSVVKPGRNVAVYVSRGPRLVTVPNVTEMSVERARELGTAGGLNVRKTEEQHDDVVQKGYVLSQDPGAGEQVAPGSRVKVVVSLGPEPPPPPPEPVPTDTGPAPPIWGPTDTGTAVPPPVAAPLPTDGSAGKVRSFGVRFQIPASGYQEPVGMQIVTIDERGESIAVDEQRRLGEFVSRKVDAVGKRVTVRIYLNGTLFSEEIR